MFTAPAGFLGLDIGTSGVKALLVDETGVVLASAHAPLALATPQAGWAEQDPDDWWRATCSTIADIRAQAPDVSIAAVGLSGQMHSSVFLDEGSAVIRPALLWCDGRTTAECAEIVQRAGGEAQLRDWVCNPALEGFTLPKVLWLRTHEPEAFARVRTILLAKDFIRLRLTGRATTEPSDASGTLMFDPVRGRWQADLLRAMSLTPELLPPVDASGAVHGTVSVAAAALTGLTAGTPVVGGGADNACGAAGVGVVAPGLGVASWGTSGTVLATVARPIVDPLMRAHTFAHVAPDTWYVMGVVLQAGGAFAWYRDQLAHEASDRALDDEAAQIAPGAGGVTFLPYLQGERTPHRDASARGALLGLSLAHSRAHVTRAVLEGVGFAMKDALAILESLGIAPASLLLTGGGARSPLLRELQAAMYARPVTTVNREEGPAFGAALLAMVGAGAYASLAEAAAATIARGLVVEPAPGAWAPYAPAYARYRAAYGALRAITAMA
jgi:xylulokinase